MDGWEDTGIGATVAPEVPGYRLSDLIGSGTSGAVWRARRDDGGGPRADPPGGDVAVKVVRGGERAERELAVLRGLRHDHVVTLHEGVPLDDGSLALVLDLVEGGTLAQLVAARGHLRPGEVVTVLAPLATTLRELHAHGIQHGDLAPGNVLLDRDGRPLLADLGTVRITGELRQEHFGTPGYVDPVVLAGGPAGPASDVYGLGALAWFALTGSAPPSPLQRASLGDTVPGLPGGLARVVEEALDPDPQRRPDPQLLARRLYDSTRPEPVWLAGLAPIDGGLTHRIRQLAAADEAPEPRHRARRRGGAGRVRTAVASWVGGCAARLPFRSGGRSRPVSLVAVAGLALVSVATVVGVHRWVGSGRVPLAGRAATAASPPGSEGAVASDHAFVTPRTPDAADLRVELATRSSAAELDGALQQLCSARARALATADASGLAAVTRAGSPADRQARADVAALHRAGLRYRGLRLQVRSAHVSSAGSSRRVVDVVVDVSGYDVIDGHGAVTQRVAPRPGTTSRLVLVATAQGWRVDDVLG